MDDTPIEDEKFSAYFSCQESQDGKIKKFHICNSREIALKWCDENTVGDFPNKLTKNEEFEEVDNEKVEKLNDDIKENTEDIKKNSSIALENFSSNLNRFVKSLKSFYDLISINSIVEGIFPKLLVDREFEPFRMILPLICNESNHKIYGVPEERVSALNSKIKRLEHTKDGISSIPANVLMGIVARYDANISALVRFLLITRKGKLGSGEKSILVKDVLAANSFEELINDLIDEEIHTLMRGSHEDQVSYIEENFSIKIKNDFERWGEFVEIFERRNLAAHGEGFANARYVKICERAKAPGRSRLEIGSRVILNESYLRNATDVLLEFGTLLIWWLWLKQNPKDVDDAYNEINGVTYELICEKRYKLSARILKSVLSRNSQGAPDIMRRMMAVKLANCLKKTNDNDGFEKALAMFDWTASADQYKISIAALRMDIDTVCEIMPRVVDDKVVGKWAFRDWPVFDWVRNDDRVKERFREVFGEPLQIAVEGRHEQGQSAEVELSTDNSIEEIGEGQTKH